MVDAQHYHVVISGAGIVGATLALALRDHGLTVALIEARALSAAPLPTEPGPVGFDSRVSALTPRSRMLFEKLGVWPAIEQYRSCAYHHMTVWDAQGTGEIEFDASEVDVAALGHIVENRVITRALLELVGRARDITVLCPHSLTACQRIEGGMMQISLDSGECINTDLLVAADGALSPIRGLMAFETREWDYGHRALVTTVQMQRPHQNTAWQRFLPSGPLALLPLPSTDSGYFCSIVWSLDEDLVEGLLACDDAEFCRQLGEASEHRLGDVLGCGGRFAFPLRQRHAVDYVQSGVALVGDAAHTIHPLAGQGVNLGLQDVAALAEEILAATGVGDSAGSLINLRRYQRRRKGDNLLMMTAMDGFKRLFEQQALPLRWLRNAGMRGVGRLGPVKRQLIKHAMGIGP
ncbi:MAG: 2-octaprenylphenol hydroxylase [Halieaceae bacterium]|jgi:2-octaprenylphenol hydroxylase